MLLRLRARVPGQGHPGGGRPGRASSSRAASAAATACASAARTPSRSRGTRRPRPARRSDGPVAAIVAPSFPAEFTEAVTTGSGGACSAPWASTSVHEVALRRRPGGRASTASCCEDDPDGRYIATTCPAVVSYVRKYHPDLLPYLAPIVSPMVAMARVLRHDLGARRSRWSSSAPASPRRARRSDDQPTARSTRSLTFAELRDMLPRGAASSRTQRRGRRLRPAVRRLGAALPHHRAACCRRPASPRTCWPATSSSPRAAASSSEAIDRVRPRRHADTRLLDVLSCEGCSCRRRA